METPNLDPDADFVALLPLPGNLAIIALIFGRIRRLDEFQKRIHFEAVVIGFLGADPAGSRIGRCVAMLLDGAAFRWYPALYRVSDHALRLRADLLWGNGIGLLAALVWRWVTLARRLTNSSMTVSTGA